MDFLNDPRFTEIEKFNSKVWLSSPTMHGDEQRWVDDAIQTNWVSTVGRNIDEVEKEVQMRMYGISAKAYGSSGETGSQSNPFEGTGPNFEQNINDVFKNMKSNE